MKSALKNIGNGSKIVACFFVSFSLFILKLQAQEINEEYQKKIIDRSAKIVNTLGLKDSTNYNTAVKAIANQYFQLNTIQEKSKQLGDSIKKLSLSKEEFSQAVKQQEEKKSAELGQLHQQFIALLKASLTEEQIEKVKNGMTYSVLPITYAAYQDMIPTLTKEQKDKIYAWLVEARELAMDAESSEKKHAVFGKYKGRINNYLAGAGYDLKKEGEEWEKRKAQANRAK